MTYRGRIQKGVLVLDSEPDLPDGTEVQVDIRPTNGVRRSDRSGKPTVGKGLRDLAGQAEGLPPDAARNVDHYLYGHPRR